jgi:hypothetical protein
MEGEGATEGLGPKKKDEGHARALATTAARWRPGGARAEAGWRGALGRRLEERGYGGGRPRGAAWELPEARGGASRAAATVSGGGLLRGRGGSRGRRKGEGAQGADVKTSKIPGSSM